MNFKIISFYFTLLVFLAGCMGGGNEELAEATFGIQMTVSPANQTLEDPATLAQDITVTVTSEDGSPSKGSKISFKLLNAAESGAQLLAEFGTTDKSGQVSTQVIGGDDFGKIAKIKVSLNGTKLSQIVKVAIRNKIVPTRVQIMDPPQEIVAGKPFQIGLRLVDDNGRVAEDEEFNDGFEMQVTTRSISGLTADPSRFNKTSAVDRTVTFEEGIGYIQGVTYTKAEDVTVELYDHGGYVSLMESRTGKTFRIDDNKTFRFVPDSPVRAQLEDMVDVTTDDAAKAEIKIYDQYDNHAYNFGSVCSMNTRVSGNNQDEAYVVDQGDSSLRNKTGVVSLGGGVGKFDIRDSNVETATVSIDGINFGCGGISNLGGSRDVDFTVGTTAQIIIRQPDAPNDTAKTTEEISLQIDAADAGGNLTPGFSGVVGIDFDGGCSADINNDDEEVADSRNVRMAFGTKVIRVFNRYLDRKNAETCLVSLRGTADTALVTDMTSTATIRFVPGDPIQFSFVNAIVNGEVGWGTLDSQRNRMTVDVEQLDTWGNPIITGGNLKQVYVVSDGSSEINNTGNKKLVTFNAAGKGDFEFYNTKNETVTLRFLDATVGMRHTQTNSENVAVENPSPLYTSQAYFKWGIPTQVEIQPVVSGNVDAPLSVDVQVQDYGGNIVQDFGTNAVPRNELKMLVNSGTVTLMDDLEFINGLATVRAQNTKEESVTFSLDLNDGVTNFKNSQNIDVVYNVSVEDAYYKWGSAGRKFILIDPADTTVDSGAEVKVQVVDQFNNPIRDYGCSAETEDISVIVNGTSKITTDSAFDHTNLTAFDNLTQSVKVDIKAQSGACPLADPANDTFTDASFGKAYVFVRSINPYDSDYQQVNISLDDSGGVGYILSPSSGVNVSFLPGAVAEYRAQNVAGTVDDPVEVPFDALDQFENKVVTFAGNDVVQFRWVFQGSDVDNQASINLNADGIPGNGDDRVDGDLFIDFKAADRGTGYIYLSATRAETIQVGLVSLGGSPVTSQVADVLFKAGVVSQLEIAANQVESTINTDSKAYFGVRALDQYGNLNDEYDDNNIQVTANKSAKILVNPTELDPNNYVLNTPVPIVIENGIGEFYAYDPVKETATLNMIDNINRGYTLIPLDVDFLHGNPVQVAIAQINSTQIVNPAQMEAQTGASAPALIKVQVQDRNGNVADTYSRTGINSVQIDAKIGGIDVDFLATNPAQDDIPSDDADESFLVDIANGEGQVYVLARKVGSKDLFINPLSTGLNAEPASDETAVTLNIVHGETAKFGIFETIEAPMPGGTLTNFPNETVNGTTDNAISMTVRAYDYYNNLASSDDSSEVVFSVDKQAYIVDGSWQFGSAPIGVAPYKSVKLNMQGGQAGFEVRDLSKETGITSSLSQPSDPGVDVGHIRPINVNFGQPYYFAIIKPPVTNTSVDNVYNVTVEVRDQNHNLIGNGFTGEVDFEVDGEAFLNNPGDQQPATGKPNPGSEMQVRKLEFLAGNPGSAVMPVWNRKAETINLSLVAGTGKNLANNASLQVNDLANPSELKTLTFSPGYPDYFELQTPAVADSFGGVDYHSDADNPLTIVAKAYDKYSNYCTNYAEGDAIQISLASASNAAYVTTIADPDASNSDVLMDFGSAGGFPQGEGRIVIRDKIKENITATLIDVKADGVDWTANQIVIKNKWGAPKMFHIGSVLGDDPVGNNGPRALRADVLIRVEAVSKDDYGNTVLDFNGKSDLQVIGQQVFYPEGQTFTGFLNGSAFLGYEQRKVGSSTIRLVDNIEAPTMRDYQLEAEASQIVTILPGVPEQFSFIDPLDPVDGNPSLDILAGDDLLVTIEAQDKWGNRAVSFDGVGADARIQYSGGTGTIKDAGNNYVTNPVPFTFTGGAATVTLRNNVLDRQVAGIKNEPIKGETVTMGFLAQTDTSSWTADGNPMDYGNTLDITFNPNTPKTLTVVDYAAAGPYPVDDPVELRVEARDEFGNYTDEYSGNFNLNVNKNAWAYQGAADSSYQLLPTEDMNGQDSGIQTLPYTITATPSAGWKYVLVADLTSENNVTVNVNSGTNGIVTHESTDISFKHGSGVYYDIVFTDQEGVPVPEFSTDKHRPVEVRVLDKGANIVLNHPTHDVRIVSDNTVTSEFTGDDPADDGKISVSGGIGQANYLSRDDITSVLTIDTSSPGLYTGVTNSTQSVKFVAGTVAKLVFANPPLSLSADDVLIGEQAYYDANTPACSTSPGQQICPYPTQVLRVEPQDKYGNINEIEGASKRYDVTIIAHESGVPTNTIWQQPVEIVNGTAWIDYDAGTLFTQRLYKAETVDFKLANPSPTSQPDESSNTITLEFSSSATVNVTPGAATRLWVTQPADGTIDNPIGVTIEVQDAHNIDGNGNGNLVVDAPDITVGMSLYAPDGSGDLDINGGAVGASITSARNDAYSGGGGYTQKDQRDNQTTLGNDVVSGSTITIKKGIGVFNIEDLTAEDVVVSLFDTGSGTTEGAGGIYYTPANVANQSKEFKFDPGVPTRYKIVLIDSTGSVFDPVPADKLNVFDFEVRAYDKGNNFTPGQSGWAYITVDNSGGGHLEVIATPDAGEDDGPSITNLSGTVLKNVKIVNGIGPMQFKAKRAGTGRISVTSTSGLIADTNVPEVTINPGPAERVVMIDPSNIRTTLSTTVSDYNDASKQELSVVQIEGRDYFDNIARDVTGTITLSHDSSSMEAIDDSNSISYGFSFINGFDAIKSLRVRNTVAESVNLDLTASTLKNSNNVNLEIPSTAPADGNEPQDILFNPGPEAQVSLEIDGAWDANVKEDHTTTDANSDNPVPMRLRTRDIYGNFNGENNWTNEITVQLVPDQGTAVADINNSSDTETLSLTAGEATFDVRLKEFGNVDSLNVGDGRDYGQNSGMDWLNVSISSVSGLQIYNSGAGPVRHPRKLYYEAGAAIGLTMENPEDSTIDERKTITIFARDQYGNVDHHYGDGGEYVLVNVDSGDATIYQMDGTTVDNKAYFTDGMAQVRIGSTRAGLVNITMADDAGSTGSADPLSLNTLVDSEFDNVQDIYYEPGDPVAYVFTDVKKNQFDYVDPSSGDVTITHTTGGSRINVDTSAVVYLYSVDQGGNITTQLDSNDRITASFDKGDADVDSGDSLYGDFVDGEAQFVINREKSFGSDGLATLALTLQGADIGNIDTNQLKVNFDHGKTVKFNWTAPASDVSIDSIAQFTIKAFDQFDNFNDNYAGNVDVTGSANSAITGDFLASGNPYMPTVSGDSSDIDSSDLNYTGAGQTLTFTAGQLDIEVMSLRAVGYTMNLANADITVDSNGQPAPSNAVVNFINGAAKYYEIYDPIAAGYDYYDSSFKNINMTKASNGTDTLTTDFYAKVGIQALDRGGNRVTGYLRANAATLVAYDTEASPSKITEKIDFVVEGGTPYEGNSENTERVLSFSNSPTIIMEMRAKRNISYELRLEGLGSILERFPSTSGGNQKHITFLNGSLAQIEFLAGTPSVVAADQTFQLEIEAQDQFGNKAVDYNGFVDIALDDSSGIGIKSANDVDFPSDATFPAVASQNNGAIELVAGYGLLTGFQYNKTQPEADRLLKIYIKEKDKDFDATPGLNVTSFMKNITIQAGTPQQLVFDGNPTDAVVGTDAQFKLRIEDSEGNLCYNVATQTFTGELVGANYAYADPLEDKEFKLFDNSTIKAVDGGNTLTVNNGQEVFRISSERADSVDINLSDAGSLTIPVPTKTVEFNPDVPKFLYFAVSGTSRSIQNATQNAVAGEDHTVYLMTHDQFGNVATGFNGTAEVLSNTDVWDVKPATASSTYPLVDTMTFANGRAQLIVNSTTMTQPSSVELAFGNFTGSATITDKTHKYNVVIDHNNAAKFDIAAAKASETIDSAVSFEIKALDTYGNFVDDYTSKTITLKSNDSYSFNPGASIPAADGTQDDTGTLKYQVSNVGGVANRQVTTNGSGIGQFYVATKKVGTVTIGIESAPDNDQAETMDITATGGTNFSHGVAKFFYVEVPGAGTGTVDEEVNLNVVAYDRAANPVSGSPFLQKDTNYTQANKVSLEITSGTVDKNQADIWKVSATPTGTPGSGSLTSNADFTSGEAVVQLRSNKPQDITMTATSSDGAVAIAGTANTGTLTFTHGAWHHMDFISSPPVAATTTENIDFTVEAKDQYNNRVTSLNSGTISIVANTGTFLARAAGLTKTGGQDVSIPGGGIIDFNGSNGRKTFSGITVTNSGGFELDGNGQNQQTVNFGFADGDLVVPNPDHSSAKHNVVVTHSATQKYRLMNSWPSGVQTVGNDVDFEIQIVDEHNNIVWSPPGTPSITAEVRTSGDAQPAETKLDGGATCSNCNSFVGTFTDGVGTVKINSVKKQIMNISIDDPDGAGPIQVITEQNATGQSSVSQSFTYNADNCTRLHFADNGDFTPANPNDLTVGAPQSQISKTVDDQFAVKVQGMDKYGNLDQTCTKAFTLVGIDANDVSKIDWNAGFAPGAFSLSAGERIVTLQNKKGNSTLKLYLEFADEGSAWGWSEKLTVNMDHGVTDKLRFAGPANSGLTIDNTVNITVQAYDQFDNVNNDFGSGQTPGATVELYTSDTGTPNLGPFLGTYVDETAGGGTKWLSTARTITFAGGQASASIQNWNTNLFTLNMQNASAGISDYNTISYSFGPGQPSYFTLDQKANWDYCQTDGDRTSQDHPQTPGYSAVGGCHPLSAVSISDDLEFTLRAKDKGHNDSTNYNGTPGWSVQVSADYSNVANEMRVLDSTAPPATFNDESTYGNPSYASTTVAFANGVGSFKIGTQYETYNCNPNMGGYSNGCNWRKPRMSLDFTFAACGAGVCPMADQYGGKFRSYFGPGRVDKFYAENLAYVSTTATDHSFRFDLVPRDGLKNNRIVEDFNGNVTITALDPGFNCTVPSVTAMEPADEGEKTVSGMTCTLIPLDGSNEPQMAATTTLEINGDGANGVTTIDIDRVPGDPNTFTAEGSTFQSVSSLGTDTNYAKITISLRDIYNNPTNKWNGGASVNLNFGSQDISKVGLSWDGIGTPDVTGQTAVNISGFVDGQKDVWIKSEKAEVLELSFSGGQDGASNSISGEATNHQIEFAPASAVEYVIVNNDNGSSVANPRTDDWTVVRVEARDQFGNISTQEDNKTVTVGGSGTGFQAQNPGTTVLVNNGTGTTEIRRTTPGSMNVTLSNASNGSVDEDSTFMTFTIDPGVPRYVAVVSTLSNKSVQDAMSGGIAIEFDLWDQFDNPTKPYTGTVSVNAVFNQSTSRAGWGSIGTGTTPISWGLGHTPGSTQTRMYVTDIASNNHQISFTSPTGSGLDAGVNNDHGLNGSKTYNIRHGLAYRWRMNINDIGSTIYSNTDQQYQVTVQMMDEWYNVCNTAFEASRSVSLQANVTAGVATSYVQDDGGQTTATSNSYNTSSGTTTFFVRSTARSTLSLKATDGSLVDSPSKSVEMRWGSPAYMEFTTFDASKATGDPADSYIVKIYDGFDNHIKEYGNNASYFSHLGITPGNVSLTNAGFTPDGAPIGTPSAPSISPSSQAWSSGQATFTISSFESAGLFSVQASDQTSGTGAGNKVGNINITPAGATKVWIAPPSGKGIVSQATDVTVYTMDDFNNFADYSGSIQLCSDASGTIPTGRYTDDSNTQTTKTYFDNPGTYCKTINFSNQSQATYTIRVDQGNGFGYGWNEIDVASAGTLQVLNTDGHEDFYFQPGDPVKYELVLETHGESGQPAANLFHSTVDSTTRDASHLVSGVKRTVQIKAVDVTGAVATTWGGVATLDMGGDAQFANESITVDLTQGEGSFDIYDQFVENVHLRVIGTSDNTVSVYNQNNSGTACDTCEINLVVSRSKAETFKVTSINNGSMSFPDSATNKSRINHNRDSNGDYVDVTYEILDEGGARFGEYLGKFRGNNGYWEAFIDFSISGGIKSGQWITQYYPGNRTPSFQTHPDYSGRSLGDMQIANNDYDTVTFVHDSPDRIYVYCPVSSLISDTASVATCRMKIKDNQYNRSTTYIDNNTWGADVTNFQGGKVDLVLKDTSDNIHPNAIVYVDTDNSGVIETDESDATFEGDRGAPKTVNFESGRAIYYFGVHSASEGNVEVSMNNGVYNGDKWHTYLGGSANTDIPFDGVTSPIKYADNGSYTDQTIFFQAAPTTDMTMVITGSDALVNPTGTADTEYYEITVTAKIANGSVNLNEDGYVYLDAQCHGAEQVGYLEDVYASCGHWMWMKDHGAGGSYSDTNSKLGQFINGVATFRVFAKKVGDIKFHLRHPGSSSVAFVDNDQVKRYDSNPATKYKIAWNYNPPGDGSNYNTAMRLISNSQPHASANSHNKIEVRAVDADNRIDANYNETNVPITITCTEQLSTDSCIADLSAHVDGDENGTAGDGTVNFTNGRAYFQVLTNEVGEFTVTASDPSGASFGAQADGSIVFSSEWPEATKLIELTGNRDESIQGKVTFYYEARDDYDNLAGDFLGSYAISYDIDDGTLSGSSDGMFFVGGQSSFKIESSKGQTVNATFADASGSGVDITGDVGGTPTANQYRYTFVGGKAVGLRITQQPIGNVKTGDFFEQSLKVDIIDADEEVVSTGVDSTIGIEVTPHLGASCSNEILDSSVTQDGDTNLDETTSSGTFVWDKLASNTAQTISFKVKDANSRWPGACTTVTNVYDNLVVTVDGGVTGSGPGDAVIFELSGGVPALGVSLSTSTDSTAVLVGSSEPGCDGTQCVKYTPGRSIASDTVTVTDAQTANLGANVVNINMQVEAADFTFDDGDDPANPWSTVATNDLGSFTNDNDEAHTIVVNNSGTAYSSGELSMVFTADQPDMWNFNPAGCTVDDPNFPLASGGSCNAAVTFKADTGLSGPGTYTGTLTVQGQNGSAEKVVEFQATLEKTIDVLDPDDSYNIITPDSTHNMGNFSNVSDVFKVFRYKNNGTTASGNLTFTFDEGLNPGMWELTTDGCTGQELTAGQNCEVVIKFKANTGVDGAGTYDSSVEVVSPVLGTTSIGVRATRN